MASGNCSKRALTEPANRPIEDSVALPHLPDEIIAEILPRLPVKSLLRFRCVSKSWCALISSPEFVSTHLTISTNNNNKACHNRLMISIDNNLDQPGPRVFHTFLLNAAQIDEISPVDTLALDCDADDAIRIVGSCDGLVCVVLGDGSLVLWNPATRKSKKLPSSDGNRIRTEYGFGYDASSDDFRVVECCLVYNVQDDYEAYETEVKAYSCRDDSWKDMDWPGGVIFDGPGVFLNGAIHWKVYHDTPNNWGVCAMTVATGACSRVELPRLGLNVSNFDVTLGVVSRGSLCALYDYRSYMDVWVMKEYGAQESWTKLICSAYYFHCARHLAHVRPKMLFVSESGGILLSLGSDLILFIPPNCHSVHWLGSDIEVEGVTYSESLLSPDFDSVARS